MDTERGVDFFQVSIHCIRLDAEVLRDFGIGQSTRGEPSDLLLARGERLPFHVTDHQGSFESGIEFAFAGVGRGAPLFIENERKRQTAQPHDNYFPVSRHLLNPSARRQLMRSR